MTLAMMRSGFRFSGNRSITNNGYAKVKIQLFGDSVQRGYASSGGGVRVVAYPEALVRDYFDKLYGVGEVLVSTRAVDSTHAGMLVGGTDGLNLPWPGSVDADIILINHGVNDAAYTVAGMWSEAQYSAALNALAAAPAQVIFQTPTPVSNANPNFAPAMRAVAANTGTSLIDVREYIDGVSAWYSNYSPDGIHLNEDGYRLIYGNCIIPALVPVVSAISGRS